MIARALAWIMSRLPDGTFNDFIDELRELDRARLFTGIAGHWRQRRGAGYLAIRTTHLLATAETVFVSESRAMGIPKGRN